MWGLNDVLDYDTACYSAEMNKKLQPPECTGKIPAGQRHQRWHGASRGIEGLDFDDPKNAVRLCVHCVRASNWDRDKNRLLVTRVEFTYSDGTKRVLEDEAADDWTQTMAGADAIAGIHGYHCESGRPPPWKTIPAPKAKRPSKGVLRLRNLIRQIRGQSDA